MNKTVGKKPRDVQHSYIVIFAISMNTFYIQNRKKIYTDMGETKTPNPNKLSGLQPMIQVHAFRSAANASR